MMVHQQKIRSPAQKNSAPIWRLAILTAAIAAVGTLLLALSRAAVPAAAVEAEAGTRTAQAMSISDLTASQGKAVRFTPAAVGTVSADTPCVGATKPAQWKHVVVLIFENKTYNEVIGTSDSPFITSLAHKCGSYTNWKDANYKASGQTDGSYVSKPNYATLTSGVSPSVHGLTSDSYTTTSTVDNIFNRLRSIGKSAKVYQSGGTNSCATSNFSGAYHDPLRYYTNLGAQSADPTSYCNQNDLPIGNFMTDVTSGNLPAYSVVLPTNNQNTHNNTIASGDAWAEDFLTPLLNSNQYKSGDTAIFFLWDEDTPIPNVLLAPSIKAGSQPAAPASGAPPIGHFSATRTWQEMLGVTPFLGDTGQAPSLLTFFNGG
jgi:phospholipase C